MQYLTFKTPPRIRFAHKYSSPHNVFTFAKGENVLEITAHTKGRYIIETGGGDKLYPENSLFLNRFGEASRIYYFEPQEHYTVSIEAEYELSDTPSEFAVPVELCITEENTVKRFLEKIKGIIALRQSAPNRCRETAAIFDLFSLYTDYRKLCDLHYSDFNVAYTFLRYGKRAQDYIAMHIGEKIAVEDIARNVGLSCGYLSKLFKQYTGETIVRYINRKRLEVVLDIVKSKQCTLAEACAQLNLFDPNYVSLMYKKYYGKTFSELLGNDQ